MTVEEIFSDLYDEYGEDFNWYLLPRTNTTFVAELKKELGKDHLLADKHFYAVAKCEANDDVLYRSSDKNGNDRYYIFHLTYAAHPTNGFPRYRVFADLASVKAFIEQEYIADH